MPIPKLILLDGFAGSGKTTIAKRYIDEHPLALVVEGDTIIVNIGQWEAHEDEARALMFEITKSLARTHLTSGNDVILPYLLTKPDNTATFEAIAHEAGATYHEVIILDAKETAVSRLLKRGSWGEPGSLPFTDKDLPIIEDLYDRMISASNSRTMKMIRPDHGDIEGTYQEFLRVIAE